MIKIAVHSFKGGTGKSTISANLAVMLANEGKNVAVVDLDLAGPGLHVLFKVKKDDMKYTMNDIFLSRCSPLETVVDLTSSFQIKRGKLLFIPASYKAEDIIGVLSKGYELRLFRSVIEQISKSYNLDYLIIDTHPGIEESTLLAMGVCDTIILVSRIDSQDLFGTGVVLEVAKSLNKPVILVTNMVPPGTDEAKLKQRFEMMFSSTLVTSIPFYTEILKTLSSDIFILENPDHPFAEKLKPIIYKVLEARPTAKTTK